MFQSLASFLLGGTSDTSGGVNNGDDTTRVALRTTEHDDGWMLVDRDSEGGSDGYSSEEDDSVNDGMERVLLRRSSSGESLSHGHNRAMDESWFITPPPCFSSQAGPVQLRTSPLENLLIEHPSMSVYLRTGNRHPLQRSPTPSDNELETVEQVIVDEVTEEEEEEDGGVELLPQRVFVAARTAPAVHRCNRPQHDQQIVRQKAKRLEGQKAQMKRRAKQATTRGCLGRSNKAREANGRNWNPRRKERCQGSARSHANNNRKC